MAIKINKQLNRPDGGKVSSGSIVKYDTRLNGKTMIVWFFLNHYISQTSIDSEKETIPKIEQFNYKIFKDCTPEQWAKLNDAGSAELVESWLKEELEKQIGIGYIEII